MQNTQTESLTTNRFDDIDQMSGQLFDDLVPILGTSSNSPNAAGQPSPQAPGLDEDLCDIAHDLGNPEPASSARVAHDDKTASKWFPRLPEGVDFLQSKPSVYSEEDTNAAIRVVMLDQRREINKRNLPELAPAEHEPAQLLPGLDMTTAERCLVVVPENKEDAPSINPAYVEAFKLTLACALLALVVIVNIQAILVAFFYSLCLMLVFSFVLGPEFILGQLAMVLPERLVVWTRWYSLSGRSRPNASQLTLQQDRDTAVA